MNETNFTTWKYQHPDSGHRSPKRRIAAAIALVAGLLTVWPVPPLGIFLLLAAAVLFFASVKQLRLGPRYLICGKTIVYYANVTKVHLDENGGRLTLYSGNDRGFSVDRDKFPTNARKKDKIARNKAAKFDKAARKIIAKVLKASPDAETLGFSRAAYLNE